MTPAIMKKFVMMYINTIAVLMQAIRSASVSELPAFSPKALAHMRQSFFKDYPSYTAELPACSNTSALLTRTPLPTG